MRIVLGRTYLGLTGYRRLLSLSAETQDLTAEVVGGAGVERCPTLLSSTTFAS
jgi:hypothetical protein